MASVRFRVYGSFRYSFYLVTCHWWSTGGSIGGGAIGGGAIGGGAIGGGAIVDGGAIGGGAIVDGGAIGGGVIVDGGAIGGQDPSTSYRAPRHSRTWAPMIWH